jgi:transcriptional regulator with XRE-family HTH domain
MSLFGSYLKHFRTEKGLSLRRIAEAAGVDPSILSRLERGEVATPSEDLLTKLPELLDRPQAEVYLASGRITPGLAAVLDRGLPLTVQQASKALTLLEEQLSGMFSEVEVDNVFKGLPEADQATATKISEAMMHIAELVQAMEEGRLTQEQFEHIADSIKHLKLSHLAAPAQEAE